MKRASLVSIALAALVLTATSLSAGAAGWKGSIKVKGKHTTEELAKLAKVSQSDAEKTALAAIESAGAAKTT